MQGKNPKPTVMKKLVMLIGVLLAFNGLAQEESGGLIYKLDVNPSEQKINKKQLSDFEPIEKISEDGLSMYRLGNYKDFLRAQLAQYQLMDKGFNTVSLKAFHNGNEITMEDAYALMDTRNEYEQNNITPVSSEELDDLLRRIRRKSIDIKVKVELVDGDDVAAFFELPDSVDAYFTKVEGNVIYFSKFDSFYDASQIFRFMQASGLNHSRIVAFQWGEEIALIDALNDLKKPVTLAFYKPEHLSKPRQTSGFLL